MVKLSQQETKSLVALHGWSAVLLGLLLYAVVATGAVAVLAEEIRHWSIGTVKHENPLLSDVDSIVRNLSVSVEPEFLEEVGMGASPHGNLELFFHTHRNKPNGEIEEYGVEFEVDPQTYAVLDKRQGTGLELHRTQDASALSRFLVDIHTELHLPRPWGLLLTGILGLAMMVAAVSGFLMHRHLFTDMFVLRRERSNMVKRRDVHTVAGTWGLPFAFILAFTGSFFSFAGSFGLPAMAMVAFGGDQEAMIRTIIGVPETESDRYMEPASINRILAHGYEHTGNHAEFAAVTHFGRDDAKVLLFMPPEEAKLDSVQLEYDGVSGEFVRQKPGIGITPSLGSAVLSLMGPLHFGDFAGLLVQVCLGRAGFCGLLRHFKRVFPMVAETVRKRTMAAARAIYRGIRYWPAGCDAGVCSRVFPVKVRRGQREFYRSCELFRHGNSLHPGCPGYQEWPAAQNRPAQPVYGPVPGNAGHQDVDRGSVLGQRAGALQPICRHG